MSYEALYLSMGVLLAVMGGAWLGQRVRRSRGRLRVRHFAFLPSWLEVLERNVPLYGQLPLDLRVRLQDRMIGFMDGKRWKHCGGLGEVTDEMKVTIAGQACLLELGRGVSEDYARILNVLVYPWSGSVGGGGGLPPVEAWPSASVLLGWEAGMRRGRDLRDEGNEVLAAVGEEMGLQGVGSGGRAWGEGCQYSAWARVMSGRFAGGAALGAALGGRLAGGAVAEVFAAATELFFEWPGAFLGRCPEGYEQLRAFYKLDPARWLKR